jgi:hypothetical protein
MKLINKKGRIIQDLQDLSTSLIIYPERYRFAVNMLQTFKIDVVKILVIGCNIKISKSMTYLKFQRIIYFEFLHN